MHFKPRNSFFSYGLYPQISEQHNNSSGKWIFPSRVRYFGIQVFHQLCSIPGAESERKQITQNLRTVLIVLVINMRNHSFPLLALTWIPNRYHINHYFLAIFNRLNVFTSPLSLSFLLTLPASSSNRIHSIPLHSVEHVAFFISLLSFLFVSPNTSKFSRLYNVVSIYVQSTKSSFVIFPVISQSFVILFDFINFIWRPFKWDGTK